MSKYHVYTEKPVPLGSTTLRYNEPGSHVEFTSGGGEITNCGNIRTSYQAFETDVKAGVLKEVTIINCEDQGGNYKRFKITFLGSKPAVKYYTVNIDYPEKLGVGFRYNLNTIDGYLYIGTARISRSAVDNTTKPGFKSYDHMLEECGKYRDAVVTDIHNCEVTFCFVEEEVCRTIYTVSLYSGQGNLLVPGRVYETKSSNPAYIEGAKVGLSRIPGVGVGFESYSKMCQEFSKYNWVQVTQVDGDNVSFKFVDKPQETKQRLTVVGLPYSDFGKVVKDLKNLTFVLEAEPGNMHDKNAVRVMACSPNLNTPVKVGYIAKSEGIVKDLRGAWKCVDHAFNPNTYRGSLTIERVADTQKLVDAIKAAVPSKGETLIAESICTISDVKVEQTPVKPVKKESFDLGWLL